VPAVSFEFPDGIGYGDLYFTHEELSGIVADLDAQGYQVAIHTAGDRSLELIQDVYTALLEGGPKILRHRIEHNAVIRPELMSRYPESGIVLTIFGLFPTCYKISDDYHFKFDVPDEYQTWEWPWRDLLDANPDLPIAWHSDWPLTTFDTIQHLYGFTTRKQIADDGSICEPTPDIASGIITIQEALQIMTIGGAYALSREDEIGSLEPGKYADLIILSDNPLNVSPDDLLNIKVQLTMISGIVMYCAEGQETLFPQEFP
jgi:predicted amidohydrolase YtcJ